MRGRLWMSVFIKADSLARPAPGQDHPRAVVRRQALPHGDSYHGGPLQHTRHGDGPPAEDHGDDRQDVDDFYP